MNTSCDSSRYLRISDKLTNKDRVNFAKTIPRLVYFKLRSKVWRFRLINYESTLIINKIKLSKFGAWQIEIALSKTSINFVSASGSKGGAVQPTPALASSCRDAAQSQRNCYSHIKKTFLKNNVPSKSSRHIRCRRPTVRSHHL